MQRRNILRSLTNHRNDGPDRVTAYSGWAAQVFVNDPKHGWRPVGLWNQLLLKHRSRARPPLTGVETGGLAARLIKRRPALPAHMLGDASPEDQPASFPDEVD